MFDFEEIENKEIKRYEQRIWELDNQVKHWKSMYEKEVKLRPTKVRYINDNQVYKRTRALLQMARSTNNYYDRMIFFEELYGMYGLVDGYDETLLEDLI